MTENHALILAAYSVSAKCPKVSFCALLVPAQNIVSAFSQPIVMHT